MKNALIMIDSSPEDATLEVFIPGIQQYLRCTVASLHTVEATQNKHNAILNKIHNNMQHLKDFVREKISRSLIDGGKALLSRFFYSKR
jgi:hypothetical protein